MHNPAPPSRQQQQQQQQQQHDGRRDSGNSSVNAGAAPAQLIGGYRLGREIGKGSFAVVKKAYHQYTQEPAAIKVVTRKKLTAKLLENLEGEISILKSIQHPNIVDLRDCLKTESHIYLVMAYCACGDLSGYIKKRGQLSPADSLADSSRSSTFDLAQAAYPHPIDGGLHEAVVRSFLSQLASAIEFMRAMNIVHRDIKPQNLLLQPPEPDFVRAGHPQGIHQLKVADFGFARSLPAASLAETLCGSPLYMAPEILRYEKYDAKADLWSVGAVLFEMAVGKTPFRAQNHIELLRKIERGEDRIKFPDERSAGSLARENAKREREGERPLPPPHPIAEDIKALIRALLKRNAVERMSFEDFFNSPIIQRIEMRASAAGLEVSTMLSPAGNERISPSQILAAAASETRSQARVPTIPEPDEVLEDDEPPRLPETAAEQEQQEVDGSGSTDDAYVLIEKRNVEVNALADELQTSPHHQQQAQPLPIVSQQQQHQAQLQLQQQQAQQQHQIAPHHMRAQSFSNPIALAQQSPRPSMTGFSPSSLGSYTPHYGPSGAININQGGVSMPSHATQGPGAPSSASSSSSLARAISLASVKLFGVPTGMSLRGAAALMRMQSQRRMMGVRPGEMPDPAAAGLLATLEDLSQKAFVLSEFGDSRLAAYFPIGPHQPVPPPGTTPNSDSMDPHFASTATPAGGLGTPGPSSFSPSTMAGPFAGPYASAQTGSPRPGLNPVSGVPEMGGTGMGVGSPLPRHHGQRTASSSSIPSAVGPSPPRVSGMAPIPGSGSGSTSAVGWTPEYAQMQGVHTPGVGGVGGGGGGAPSGPTPAELAATEALMLYVRALNFIQRGTDMVRTFVDVHSRSAGGGVVTTPEINEAVQWLRARFNDTYEKAEFAKARSGDMPESGQETDKLIFDRALEIARAAAVDELENNREGAGWDRANCVLAYETAHAMLLTLLDPSEEDLALSETSVGTIEKFVRSITKRLQALRGPHTPVQA